MARLFEGMRSIGALKPTPIKINSPNAFASVSKSFGAVAKILNKTISEYEQNGNRKSTGKN